MNSLHLSPWKCSKVDSWNQKSNWAQSKKLSQTYFEIFSSIHFKLSLVSSDKLRTSSTDEFSIFFVSSLLWTFFMSIGSAWSSSSDIKSSSLTNGVKAYRWLLLVGLHRIMMDTRMIEKRTCQNASSIHTWFQSLRHNVRRCCQGKVSLEIKHELN